MRRPGLQRWLLSTCFAGVAKAETDWDDISNNLFTDLAPILALFGERVTMQFMSQAIGWEDCVILAMAPLGIITIIISSIRVGGPMWLKAIVGRARENIAVAEMELMSSTSRDVCELNNGTGIVRCQGTAPVWEFICLLPTPLAEDQAIKPEYCDFEYMTLPEALRMGKLVKKKHRYLHDGSQGNAEVSFSRASMNSVQSGSGTGMKQKIISTARELQARSSTLRNRRKTTQKVDIEMATGCNNASAVGSRGTDRGVREVSENIDPSHSYESFESDWLSVDRGGRPNPFAPALAARPVITIIHDVRREAPNLSLNLQDSSNRTEIRCIAAFALILQVGVLAFFAAMTFHPDFMVRFEKDDQLAPAYAFPLALVGTVLLVLGLMICAHVVENSTEEEQFCLPDRSSRIRMYWLQQEQTVSDQAFDAIATSPSSNRSVITMSRRRSIVGGRFGLETRTLLGSILSLIGFVVQFVGFRGMHAAASTSQLVAVAIMTILRTWLRRNLARTFNQAKLVPKHELDWLAMELERLSYYFCNSTEADIGSRDDTGRPMGSWKVDPSYDCAYQHKHDKLRTLDRLADYFRVDGKTKSGRSGHDPRWRPRTTHYPVMDSHYPNSSEFGQNAANRVLELRRWLGNLSRFRGSTTTEAIQLASALNKTQNICGYALSWGLKVHYRPPRSRMETLYTIPIFTTRANSNSNETLWHRQQERHIKQTLPYGLPLGAEHLDAILSLWLYSVKSSGVQQDLTTIPAEDQKTHVAPNNNYYKSYDEWLQGLATKPGFLVVASLTVHSMPAMIHELSQWMPEGLGALFRIERRPPTSVRAQDIAQSQLLMSVERERFIHWDMPYQQAWNEPPLQWDNTTLQDETHCFVDCCHVSQDLQHFLSDWNGYSLLDNSKGKQRVFLARSCSDDLERLYSKALYQNFLNSLASVWIKPLKLDTYAGNIRRTMNNELIKSLVVTMTEHQYGSEYEARLLVLAALWPVGVLPTPTTLFETDALTQHTQRNLGSPGIDISPIATLFTRSASLFLQLLSHMHGNPAVLYRGLGFIIELVALLEEEQDQLHLPRITKSNVENFLPAALLHGLRRPGKLFILATGIAHEYARRDRLLPRVIMDAMRHVTRGLDPDEAHDTFYFASDRPMHDGAPGDVLGWNYGHWSGSGKSWRLEPHEKDLVDPFDAIGKDFRGYSPDHYGFGSAPNVQLGRTSWRATQSLHQGLDGMTPLHIAAKNGNPEMIERIMRTYRNSRMHEVQDNRGWLPVHWAVWTGHIEEARLLVDSERVGSPFNVQGVVHICLESQNPALMEQLLLEISRNHENGIWSQTVLVASMLARWDVLRRLLSKENWRARNNGCSPATLVLIVQNSAPTELYEAIIDDTLSSIGTKYSWQEWCDHMAESLGLAASYQDPSALKALLQCLDNKTLMQEPLDGKPWRRRVMSGPEQPLRNAIQRLFIPHTKLLLEAGAEPNQKDTWGRTALQFLGSNLVTVEYEAPLAAAVRLLVQHGARIHPAYGPPFGLFAVYPTIEDYLTKVQTDMGLTLMHVSPYSRLAYDVRRRYLKPMRTKSRHRFRGRIKNKRRHGSDEGPKTSVANVEVEIVEIFTDDLDFVEHVVAQKNGRLAELEIQVRWMGTSYTSAKPIPTLRLPPSCYESTYDADRSS